MRPATGIRRAGAKDAHELAAFAERTFRAAFERSNTAANMDRFCTASFGAARQLVEFNDASRETWLVEAGDRLVAYVQLRIGARAPGVACQQPVEIQRFYLEPSQHGTGLAHELMEHVIDRAGSHRADVLWLGVWEHNPKAIAFYRKWDFEVVGEQAFNLGDEPQRDLIMRRRIPVAQNRGIS